MTVRHIHPYKPDARVTGRADMNTHKTCTFGYPAPLSSGSHITDTCTHDVAALVADAFGVAAIFAALVLWLAVTK
jgi:hypothetical protein